MVKVVFCLEIEIEMNYHCCYYGVKKSKMVNLHLSSNPPNPNSAASLGFQKNKVP